MALLSNQTEGLWRFATLLYVNDVLFSNDTGKLGKRNSECSYQESNLRPSDY